MGAERTVGTARQDAARRRGRGFRTTVLAAVSLLAGLLVQVGFLAPAADAARIVANPGSFSITANSGAAKIGSQSFTFEGDDAANVHFLGTIDALGNITVPGSGIQFPPQTVESSVATVTIIINGVGATGTINPTTGAIDMTVRLWIKINGVPLGGDCHIGSAGSPIVIPVSTNGSAPNLSPNHGAPYNQATGNFIVANNTFSVPGASDCGLANGTVNDEVGIPSGSGANELVIDGNMVPTFTGATINLTASPNPVVVNKTVTLSAAGTSTTGLTRFDWDLDGNGTYETTGSTTPTRTISFSTIGTKTVGVIAIYSDGNNQTKSTTISVQANANPVAPTQNLSTDEDTGLDLTLAASDPNGDPLTYTVLTTPPSSAGTLSGTAPNLHFAPATNFNGDTSFTYKVDDGNGGTANGTVNIHVNPVNDAPVAQDGSLSATEDTPKPVSLVATDVDGDALTYSVTTAPTKGSVDCVPSGSGSCTYTPNANANGTDSFTYTADDGHGGTDTGAITVSIAGVNDVPVIADIDVTTDEDTAAGVTLTGTDDDGDTLVFTPTSLPAHGSLTGTPPNLTYTPAANYNGPDSFTFTGNDGHGGVVAATVHITVNSVNDAPVAVDGAIVTQESTPATTQLVATDLDHDTLTFTVDTQPTGGTVACDSSGACTYTPNSGFAGSDSFTFTVDDGNGGTDAGTVGITVSALHNANPVINVPASLAVLEDTPRAINVTTTDADGDAVTVTVVTPPANGALTGTVPSLTYTPATNSNASDSFVLRAVDARGGITLKTVSITVIPVNDPPVAVAQGVTIDQGTSATVDLVATDGDGDSLTWSRKTGPSHGTASVSGDVLTYTPAAGFTGTDSVDVEAADPTGLRSRVTITFTVSDLPEAPITPSISILAAEDNPSIHHDLSFYGVVDPDGDTNLTVGFAPGNLGTYGCASGLTDCGYVPNPNATGTDTIAYTVTDSTGRSSTGAIVVTILPAPDAPTATDQTLTAAPGQTIGVTLSGTDPDGDTLAIAVTSAPTGGTVGGTAPAVTYTAPATPGTYSFGFTVTDVTGRSDAGTITVVVQPQPTPPTAGNQSLATPEDTVLPITLVGSDADGGVTFAVNQPSHGTVSGVAPNVTYLGAANYNGPDSFTFTVTDGTGNVATGTISINVTPVNDRPTAVATSATTTRTAAVHITLSASDVDGDSLTYSVSSGPSNGTVSIAGNVATYTPTGLFTGTDAFVFRATDPGGKFGSATVIVTVNQGGALATQLTQFGVAKGTKAGLALQWTYTNLNAQLTVPAAGGQPLVGQLIQFRIAGTVVCSATTDVNGRAACNGMGALLAGKATTYTATYAGSTGFAGTSFAGGIS